MSPTTTAQLKVHQATTTEFSGDIVIALFDGFFGLLLEILPYAFGILIFYIGYQWARRALGGR